MFEHILTYHQRAAREAITQATLATGERRWNLFTAAELHNDLYTEALKKQVIAEHRATLT